MASDRLKRITVEEGKCGGRPSIRGFRIRVTDLLELEHEDILAAIEYAAHQTDPAVLQTS